MSLTDITTNQLFGETSPPHAFSVSSGAIGKLDCSPRPRVYLAGPISGLTYSECTVWRNQMIEQLGNFGIEGISPMRGKPQWSGKLTDDLKLNYRSREIVQWDRTDVSRADAMFVNFFYSTRTSIGTMFEFAWAREFGIPTVVLFSPHPLDPHTEHPFVEEHTDFIVDSQAEAVAVIRRILNR